LAHVIDADGQGFVLVAAIPRTAVPRLDSAFAGGYRTLVNFEATVAGHNKFWWANSDGSASRETYDEPTEARLYPGSWAPAQFQGLDGGVVVKNWLICGPFGGPGADKFKADPNGLMPGTQKEMKIAVREFCEAASFPPDDGRVDRQAVYQGPMTQGYWNPPGAVRWKPATIADLDTRVILGTGAQVWYGATWIHVPEPTELDFQFQQHLMTHFRWSLNGEAVKLGPPPNKEDKRQVATKKLALRTGWNQIFFRGYCVGYPVFRAGLILDGPPEKLWKLRLAGEPPTL
jgi:hypothetical protein